MLKKISVCFTILFRLQQTNGKIYYRWQNHVKCKFGNIIPIYVCYVISGEGPELVPVMVI